ncbi:MAG: hypothetical protein ABIA97_02215 [Candidatus Omnitrophota bacterium]
MKGAKFTLVGFLLLSLCGCVVAFRNIDRETLGGVSFGMSKQEVKNIAGAPATIKKVVINSKEYESWIYPIQEKFVGKYNAMGYPYYEVLFLEEKVNRWHKARVYSQPEFELQHYDTPEGVRTYQFFKSQQ